MYSLILSLLLSTVAMAGPPINLDEVFPGRLKSSEEFEKNREFLYVRFNGGSACTASHVGNGFLLLAGHCYESEKHRRGYKPALTIGTLNANNLIEIRPGKFPNDEFSVGDEYVVSMPPKENREEKVQGQKYFDGVGQGGALMQPDLLLIKVKNATVNTVLKNLPAAKPITDIELKDEIVFGFGLGQASIYDSFSTAAKALRRYQRYAKKGQLKDLKTLDDIFYVNTWAMESGPIWGPGDSGSPLFVEESGQKKIYGITSKIRVARIKKNPEIDTDDDITSVQTFYVRLDNPIARKWLADALTETHLVGWE